MIYIAVNDVCFNCSFLKNCKKNKMSCDAFKSLLKICEEEDTNRKKMLIRDYAKDIDVIDYEVSQELQELGKKVIAKIPELHFINEYEVKIGYVMSYEAKIAKGRSIYADCRKVTGPNKAFLPFDFIITFYEPNVHHMTDNQKKVLMLHELKHIGIGDRGLKIENHDVEDFISILKTFGMEWNGFNQDVIDILAGGDDG